MKFKVGDRVRVIKAPNYPKYVGMVTTVVRVQLGHKSPYVLDLEPVAGFREVIASARNLAPIYDGDAPSTWAKCVWKPAGVRA